MSFQWTFIAGYLYFEIAVVTIMMLPIFSPRRWHQFFKSRLFAMFQRHAGTYFYVLLGVLCLFLLDAVREMRKYSHSDTSHTHLASEMKGNVKLFRAQRNFYITGFAIFLAFVIRRLVNMLIIQDELTVKAENIVKKAKSTAEEAQSAVAINTLLKEENKQFEQVEQTLKTLLKEEKSKVKELEEELNQWKLKFKQLSLQLNGKGDELE